MAGGASGICGTLAGLATFRANARAALLETKPVFADASGLISWLRKSVGQFEANRGQGQIDKQTR